MSSSANKEIEVRFLEIDEADFKSKLRALGAEDKGEDLFEEIIFDDSARTWPKSGKFIRLRKTKEGTILTYKDHGTNDHTDSKHGETEEVELGVSDFSQMSLILQKAGLIASRHQQKKRHTFVFNGVTIDIDTWPKIPAYVEFEGDSLEALKEVSTKLGFDWNDAVYKSAGWVIQRKYNIPLHDLTHFTFEKVE